MTGHVLYEPEDEIEAQAIIGMLENEGIDVVAQRRADTAYPGIGDAPSGWGRLLVDEVELARAQGLIADFLEAEVESTPEFEDLVPADSTAGPYRTSARAANLRMDPKRIARNTGRLGGVILFAGSLGLNAYFLLEDRHGPESAEFYDAAGRLAGRASYRDGQLVRSEEFGLDGELQSVYRDPDADGRGGRATYFSGDGVVNEFVDDDGDGYLEYAESRMRGEVRHRWYDDDADGLYERLETSRGAVFRDRDGDGFLEETRCGTLVFDSDACTVR